MIWWYGYIYDRKIFYQWNSRKHIAKEKEYWKKTMVKKHWHAEKQNQTF